MELVEVRERANQGNAVFVGPHVVQEERAGIATAFTSVSAVSTVSATRLLVAVTSCVPAMSATFRLMRTT